MNIDEIYNEWEKDGEIKITDLGYGVSQIAKLHNKYFRYYINENLLLKKQRANYKKLQKIKTEYYSGNLSKEELDEYGWEQFQLKVVKSLIPSYLESDNDLIELSLKINLCEAKVEYLESIIKMINNRGYQYRTILDYEKFKNGI